MNEFLQIVKSTPLNVWVVLVCVLCLSIKSKSKSMRIADVYVVKLYSVPFVWFISNYKTLLPDDVSVFFLMIIVGSMISFFIHTDNEIKIIKNAWSIRVPGSYGILIILLSFFIVKYCFGFLKFTNHDLFVKYSLIEHIISGSFLWLLYLRSTDIVKYYFGYLKVTDYDLSFKYYLVERIISALFFLLFYRNC